MSVDDIQGHVQAYTDKNTSTIETQRWLALSPIMTAMRSEPALRWAAPLDIKNVVEGYLDKRFGPKGAQAPAAKPAKEPKPAAKVRSHLHSINVTKI